MCDYLAEIQLTRVAAVNLLIYSNVVWYPNSAATLYLTHQTPVHNTGPNKVQVGHVGI